MENDYSKIAPTAFFQAYYRTLHDVPYAKEIAAELHAEEKYHEFHGADVQSRLLLAPVFEARYKGTDQAIHDYLEKTNTHQIVELASGLSPQGMIYTDRYPDLTYIETDLPEMIATKNALISKVSAHKNDRLLLTIANSLDAKELDKATSILEKGPVLIFNIGLLSYLGTEEKKTLCKNVQNILSKHGGAWITPDPAMHREGRKKMFTDSAAKSRLDNKMTQTTGRSYDENAFADEAETDAFFLSEGFDIEKYLPQNGYDLISPKKAGLASADAKAMSDYVNAYAKVWIMRTRR